MMTTKTRFRFTDEYDLHLAREVYGHNPYQEPKRWGLIQINMLQITGNPVSIRTLRERMYNLIKKHEAKVKSLQGKSGIEINTTELDDLLQQISELLAEFRKNKTKNMNIVDSKSSYQKAYEAREKACTSSTGTDTESTVIQNREPFFFEDEAHIMEEVTVATNFEDPEINENREEKQVHPQRLQTEEPAQERVGKKRPFAQRNILSPARKRSNHSGNIKQNTIQYLSMKNERAHDIRCRELALQERQQLLAEKKYEDEANERKKRLDFEERRLEMEEKRIKIDMEIFYNQQELFKIILKKEST